LHASIQRVIHRGQDLVDRDLAIVIRIGGFAAEELGVARGRWSQFDDSGWGQIRSCDVQAVLSSEQRRSVAEKGPYA
jgi:hypothetical protein